MELYASASSGPQRIAGNWQVIVSVDGKYDVTIVLTLKCRNCHVHVKRSTAICVMLYHNAREFVVSERLRKSASRSR
jgi:hypothetical protein